MSHYVKCYYCGENFDRDKIPFVQIKTRRYAHKSCFESRSSAQKKEDEDRESLDKYIMSLFSISYVDPRIQNQIKQFIDEYNFTYSGIKKSLMYFYEVKKNPLDKKDRGIGIVPFIYRTAYEYYYNLWEAQQKNKDKDFKDFVPKKICVTIPIPEKKLNKRKLFSFIESDDIEEKDE